MWRWFSEDILHCASSELMKKGMNLEQITQLARCNGLHTMTFRPTSEEVPKFKLLDQDLIDHQHNEHTTEHDCSSHVSGSSNNEYHDHYKLLHHNTTAAYVTRCDQNFLRTAVFTSSRRQGLHAIANISR